MFSVHIIIICRYVFRKYYTDHHDVDEDTSHANLRGGSYIAWLIPPASGVFAYAYQCTTNPGNPDVASKNNIQPPSFTRRLCHVLFYNFTMLIILWISVA